MNAYGMIFSITLEENGGGNMPDMSGRVFKINVGKHRDVHNRFQFRVYKIKWLDPAFLFYKIIPRCGIIERAPKDRSSFPKDRSSFYI